MQCITEYALVMLHLPSAFVKLNGYTKLFCLDTM